MSQYEFPLEDEQSVIDILRDTLSSVIGCDYSHEFLVSTITLYLFTREYYFRRDHHVINLYEETITIYLYRSKMSRNLYKFQCPIVCSHDFVEWSTRFSSHRSPSHRISVWIDTECKEDHFTESKSANMMDGSYFMMMTKPIAAYHPDNESGSRSTVPWIVQWRYDALSMPFIQIIARIISFPSDWNYVTLSYQYRRPSPLKCSKSQNAKYLQFDASSDSAHCTEAVVAAVFYTATQQHSVELIPDIPDIDSNGNSKGDSNAKSGAQRYSEKVTITQFASGLNYPWLMFGSAVTKIISHRELCCLFGNEASDFCVHPLSPSINAESEYFVTRSCKDFEEMKDHGAFWTTARDYISVLEIAESSGNGFNYKMFGKNSSSNLSADSSPNEAKESEVAESVAFNVSAQIPVVVDSDKLKDGKCSVNVLDVTVTHRWSCRFQREYGVKGEDLGFMVLFTMICHDLETVELYAAYLMVRGSEVTTLRRCKLAESQCLTKFLVGRGMHQTVDNEWICTLIGIDESHREVRYQLRLTEQFELLYHQKVRGNENVQEVTDRYKCRALKHFERAEDEEKKMRQQQPVEVVPSTVNMMWRQWQQITNSPHLILTTMVGAYIGFRVSRALFGNFANGGMRFRLF